MQYVLLDASKTKVLDIFEPEASIIVPERVEATIQDAIHNHTNQYIILSLKEGSILHIGQTTAVGPNIVRLGPKISMYDLELPVPLDGLYVYDITTTTLAGEDALSSSDTY